MDIPDAFVAHVRAMLGAEAADAWLTALPTVVAECAARWQIHVLPAFPNLTYNYVAPAVRADGMPTILKLYVPYADGGEYATQVAALRVFDGRGAARWLASDDVMRALLMERVTPGETIEAMALSGLAGDAEATRIAAEVMLALWRPVAPDLAPFPTLIDWAQSLLDYAARFPDGDGPLPGNLVARAVRTIREGASDGTPPVLLHGDLHHTNILANADSASRPAWLAIDPKGIIGPPGFEVGTFLRNPLSIHTLADAPQMLAQRIAILSEMLALPRDSLREWGIAFCMLSAAWGVEDDDPDENGLAVAAMLADLASR